MKLHNTKLSERITEAIMKEIHMELGPINRKSTNAEGGDQPFDVMQYFNARLYNHQIHGGISYKADKVSLMLDGLTSRRGNKNKARVIASALTFDELIPKLREFVKLYFIQNMEQEKAIELIR